MKTFSDLIEEVQNPGLCQRCGGCVAFCTAINYGALELDEEGKPRYKADGKCIEGGLCYSICPETHELDEEVKSLVAWEPPMVGDGAGATTKSRLRNPGCSSGDDGPDGDSVRRQDSNSMSHPLDSG